MRATTEFFKIRHDKDGQVIPPGEGVMGVTVRKSYKREIRELREALALAGAERDAASERLEKVREALSECVRVLERSGNVAYWDTVLNARRALNETASEGEDK